MWDLTNHADIPCWRWVDGKLTRHSLIVPDNVTTTWDLVNTYGYRSVCMWGGGLITYLYRDFETTIEERAEEGNEEYLMLTVVSGPDEAFTHAEIVLLPTWADALSYLAVAQLSITTAAMSDNNWG